MRVIGLFNLQPDANIGAYEKWARTTDIPRVPAMNSVNEFQVLKVTGLLGGVGSAPYEYVEQIDITNLDSCLEDASTPQAQLVAKEF